MYKFPFLLAIPLILFSLSFFPRLVQAAPRPVTILQYGYIASSSGQRMGNGMIVTADNFAGQMKELRNMGYTTLTLNQLPDFFSGTIYAGKPVVLTFDGATAGFYDNALPVLKKYNFHAVVFAVTGTIGTPSYMTWNQLKAANDSGLVEVESGGNSHSNFTELTATELEAEMETSRSLIQQNLGTPVNFIAYPGGYTNEAIIKAAQIAGYTGGAGVWGGRAEEITMDMPRTAVGNVPSFAGFLR